MTVFIVCLAHKRAYNFIDIIEVFVDDEEGAYKFKAKFNKDRPAYALATIKTYEVNNNKKVGE